MIAIVNNLGCWKLLAHPFGITVQHIHGYPFNALGIATVSNQGLSKLFNR